MNDLFTVKQCETGPDTILASIALRQDHPIFAGHFPGTPVLPGVCMIQIVKEIVENQKGESLRLTTSDNIKFLSVINPVTCSRLNVAVNYHATDDGYQVKAALTDSSVTYFKFNGQFTPAI